MKKVNAMEMRNVNGGARYATCYVCGKRKKMKWTIAVLFRGWKSCIQQAEAEAGLRHAWGGKCW